MDLFWGTCRNLITCLITSRLILHQFFTYDRSRKNGTLQKFSAFHLQTAESRLHIGSWARCLRNVMAPRQGRTDEGWNRQLVKHVEKQEGTTWVKIFQAGVKLAERPGCALRSPSRRVRRHPRSPSRVRARVGARACARACVRAGVLRV